MSARTQLSASSTARDGVPGVVKSRRPGPGGAEFARSIAPGAWALAIGPDLRLKLDLRTSQAQGVI